MMTVRMHIKIEPIILTIEIYIYIYKIYISNINKESLEHPWMLVGCLVGRSQLGYNLQEGMY